MEAPMSTRGPEQIERRFLPSFAKAASAAAVVAAILGMPATAEAASSGLCGSRTQLLDQLSKRYKEEPVALGVTSNGSLVEVLTSDQGSTWTIMISQRNGASCLVAVGEGWEEIQRVASGEQGA
jgi:hypothetical protein